MISPREISGAILRGFRARTFEKNLQLVERIERWRLEKHCTPAQLALAWVLAQGEDLVPIPGTKRRNYLEDNLGALDVSLSQDELARINEIAPKGITAGLRYPANVMQRIGV